MPRQANGNYIPPANTAAISGTPISSTAYNTLETDIGTEITNSLDRLGRAAMQANLPMGGNKATGAADPTNAQDLATKNYVDTSVAAFFSTGDMKPTLKTVADAGWILLDDAAFGSALSGSVHANNNTQALFFLFFNNLTDLAAPIFTSGGSPTTRAAQTDASTAWAANCRMSLPKMLGRAMGGAGAGVGLTGRLLGSTIGEENHTLTVGELPTGITSGGTISGTASKSGSFVITQGTGGVLVNVQGGGAGGTAPQVGTAEQTTSLTVTGTANVTSNNTGGGAHNIMQPTTFVNWMIKL